MPQEIPVKDLTAKGIIDADEKVITSATQRRFTKMVYPMSMIVTNKQIIIYKPMFRKYDVESHGFGRIQDIKVKARFRSSDIKIATWAGQFGIVGLRKGAAVGLLRAIRQIAEVK
jgi:hypothetical protein